ncbi:MAG: hypothetical protein R3E97_03890 [Candidatus Eisenbacteria bacterium]
MTAPVHVENTFAFEVAAPIAKAFPLFGGWGERVWAGEEWSPEFLWPSPPADAEGEVFTVGEGADQSIWVNTRFDEAAGRVQYVYVLPGVQAVCIDLALSESAASSTSVQVTYRRTALGPTSNEHVLGLGERDREQGPTWAAAIDAHLNR